jgi:hypothetical protein
MRSGAVGVLVVVLLQAGCADGPAYGDVRGEVTLDGQVIQEGVVQFTPLDGSTPTAEALITGSRFQVKVPVTKHRVSISAPKLPPRGLPGAKAKSIDSTWAAEQLIPPRYNARSELTTEVKKGVNDISFHLKSK